jgi:hemerythrin-like domain-containing protein
MGMETISDVLGQDYQYVDDLLIVVKEAAAHNDWSVMRAGIDHFAEMLLRHIDAEESVLFPAFEATAVRSGRATDVMRDEHDQLLYHLHQLESHAALRDFDAVQEIAMLLSVLLELHHPKEERVFYPRCDRGLGDRLEKVMQELHGRLYVTAVI